MGSIVVALRTTEPLNLSTSLDRLTAAIADRYTIDREIGRGGMATIHLAEDLKHHRKVAIMVLRP
jgi:serine/threonine protein kinase